MRLSTAWLLTAWMSIPSVVPADDALFRDSIAPVLGRRCVGCHSGDEPDGGLSLATGRQAMRGGESGAVIVPGAPDESLLLEYVAGDDPQMPKQGEPLSAAEVSAIRAWIAAGAAWPDDVTLVDESRPGADWWSLVPVVRREVPPTESEWIRTPIDAFVLAKLKQHGLSPAAEADRRTLIRRLTYNLHGLPPTPEEVDQFIHDTAPRAYERLVDRLLASPRYGERWGRHWLDVVHYGETHGYDKDKPRVNAWPYRDYVIRSFNEDKPYSRFVLEQLAGDVLFCDSPEAVVATGFIAAGPWDFVGHVELREGTVDKKIARLLDRDDMLATTMSTFQSLTVHCARCHDHKFDPITQADYYRVQAVFAGVDRADRPYDADPEVALKRREWTAELRTLETVKARLEGVIAEGSDAETESRLRATIHRLEEIEQQLAALPPQSQVYAATAQFAGNGSFQPADGPRPIHLLRRGDVKSPGPAVAPGAVACLPDLEAEFALENPDDEGSRRAALARWIVDPRNPLTRRSIVNRVWHYHFGRGLVDTPNDFGRMGSTPTHPELLDWLADEFSARGESIKELHRLVLHSAVYRQVSNARPEADEIDAGNRYLWRMNRARLDAESIRDAVLYVSGQLDLTMGGPSVRQFVFKDDHSPVYDYAGFDVDDPANHRRSVYRFIVRSVPDPLMERLDCADPSILTPKRNTTLTAVQALALLNNPLVVRQAEHFARRVEAARDDRDEQITLAYQLALSRDPTPREIELLSDYATHHGMAGACRVILNSNEFIFVD